MARKLRAALPRGRQRPLGGGIGVHAPDAVAGTPQSQPNRDAFVNDDAIKTTVDLAGRHAVSSLDDVDLEEAEADVEAA
jgi:hypothetical protein